VRATDLLSEPPIRDDGAAPESSMKRIASLHHAVLVYLGSSGFCTASEN
jgi:hypothetical protein